MNYHLELKNAVSALHHQLDQGADAKFIFSSDFGVENYIHFLSKWYFVLKDVEEVVHPHLQPIQSDLRLSERRRSELALADLGQLGEIEPDPSVVPPFEFARPTVARALGILYVIEGSTLGANFIGKHLKAHLASVPPEAFSMLDNYGAKRSQMWQGCLDTIEKYFDDHAEEFPACIAAAKETFHYFLHQWPATANS